MLISTAIGWLIASGYAAQALPAFRFDDAASLGAWRFSNGSEFPGADGRVAWDQHGGCGGGGGLALHYSFADGGRYVQAVGSLPGDNAARRVRLWMNKPGPHRVAFRAVDSAGRTFQKGTEYLFEGWQQIEVDLAQWEFSFGGTGEGGPRWPMRSFGVLIENTHEPREGVMLLDDIELLEAAVAVGPARYVASDFGSGPGWWVAGGGGNSLQDGVWAYRFNEGRLPPSVNTDFSLLGSPTVLRLVVEGDGPGHSVQLLMGSHMQHFFREAGRLTSRGEQVIEVPLGAMETWQHRDGQNDGQVRLPLRLRQIRLERREGPAEGAIKLKRIEVETVFGRDRSVLLVPEIRREGDEVVFSVTVQKLQAGPLDGRLTCDIRSVSELRRRERVEVSLPAESAPVRREFREPMGRHHLLEAVFQWSGSGGIPEPVAIGTSSLPSDPGSARLEPGSPIGMGLYLYRWHDNSDARVKMTELASLARRAGVKWIREEFSWERIEPAEGDYRWDFYDQLVDIVQQQGISICALLAYWSPYAKANTLEGIEQYCRWVRAVVNRYKRRIRHWEIWNEPNIFFWSGPREMYATLLTRAYETIKAEDPEAVVMGCSTSSIDTAFIEDVMKWGGRFDALTIHPYRGVLEDTGYIAELRAVKELVGGRPVWITEFGFPSQLEGGYSERRQASLAARVYLTSLASGAVDNVAWYDFRNDGTDPFFNEMNFGLVRADFLPKPAYQALATLTRALAGKAMKEQIDVEPAGYAFRFSDGRRDTVAVCSPATGGLLSFETSEAVSIVNGVGEPVEAIGDGRGLTCTLDTGFPVYIEGRAGFTFKPVELLTRLMYRRSSVHPGESVELRLERPVEVTGWDLPAGWKEPGAASCGGFVLSIPEQASAGHVDLQVIVRHQGRALRLPFVLFVQPAIIKL